MVNSLRSTRLIEWSFAAFHTAFFVLVAFTLLYASGNAANVLGALSTLIGVGVFAILWLTTWWCTRCAVVELKDEGQFFIPTLGDLLGVGAKWGAVNGLLFFLSLFGVIALVGLGLSTLAGNFFSGLVFLGIAGCIGAPIALFLGALFGIVFALIDASIARLAFFVFDLITIPRAITSLETKEEMAGR